MTISVALITLNEEANLARTLESIAPLVREGKGEIIVVDSGSTDRTLEIAKSFGAKIFLEPWKGFAGQKNSAMEKASSDWILQLDADEELEPSLAEEIAHLILDQSRHGTKKDGTAVTTSTCVATTVLGFYIPRKNFFLGRWIRHGGFYPDPKLRLVRRGAGKFEEHGAHPTIKVSGRTRTLQNALLHHAYPNLRDYIDHMNSYSSQGAKFAIESGYSGFSFSDVVIRPLLTFIYNYFFRLGFLDGREGLLLHLYHSVYVSWKYSKAWEISRKSSRS